MTTAAAPEQDRLARVGVVALGVSVVVVAVAATLAAAGLPGYEVVWAVHVGALLVWRSVGRRTFRDLLRTSGSLRWAALAVVVAGAVPAAVMAVMHLAGATAASAASGLWVGLFAALVIGGLVNGLPEELTFRGVLLRGLTPAWGQVWAVVVTALLFAALHVPRLLAQDGRVGLDDMTSLLLFGASLAVLALAARSVWPAVGWHVGSNFVSIFLPVGLGVRWSGPTWLVGAGGDEGGVLVVLEAAAGRRCSGPGRAHRPTAAHRSAGGPAVRVERRNPRRSWTGDH